MARRPRHRIELSFEERAELERIARAEKRAWREVQRARIVLYAADGLADTEIAARLDTSAGIAGRWRRRFYEHRLEGLKDKPRAGRPRRFPPEQVAEVKAIACELPATHGLPLSRYSRAELHQLVIERGVTDASASTIWRWLCEDAIKPWQQRSWIFVRDPDFRRAHRGMRTRRDLRDDRPPKGVAAEHDGGSSRSRSSRTARASA